MATEKHLKYYSKHKDKILAKNKVYSSNVKSKYTRLKSRAVSLGYDFNLTLDDYMIIVSAGVCVYCLGPLSSTGSDIDRFDNRMGYIRGNCVACCGMKDGKKSLSCNVRKGHLEGAGFTVPRTVELLKELLERDKLLKALGKP